MKTKLIIIIMLLSLTGTSQDLSKMYKDYIEICNTHIKDTVIIQHGTIFLDKRVPVYDECNIVAYQLISTDTVWEEIDSIYYLHDRQGYLKWDAGTLISNQGGFQFTSCKVTRTIKRPVLYELISERGFWFYVYTKLKTIKP